MTGCAFVNRTPKGKYAKLLTSIRDKYAFNMDVYPKTLHDAYESLENHSSAHNIRNADDTRNRFSIGGREGGRNGGKWGREGRGGRGRIPVPQYTQESEEIFPRRYGSTTARITCFGCQKLGHFVDFCREVIKGNQHHMNAFDHFEETI